MTTVAKNIDGPVKLIFVKNIIYDATTLEKSFEYSMIGLGDIVIPGIYISLALRYDQFLNKFQ